LNVNTKKTTSQIRKEK